MADLLKQEMYNEEFYERILSEGSLAMGESYIDGWWDLKN